MTEPAMNAPLTGRAESPSETVGPFASLLAEVASGSPEAWTQFQEEYGRHILRVVRHRMNAQVRARYDSQDFEQSVWKSFFGHLSVLDRFERPDQLAAWLTRVASNKVIDAGRRARVRQENAANEGRGPSDEARDHRRAIAEPTPSQFAVAKEQWEMLNEGDNNLHRRILSLKVSGKQQKEISEELGVSERHVRRILAQLARRSGNSILTRTGHAGTETDSE